MIRAYTTANRLSWRSRRSRSSKRRCGWRRRRSGRRIAGGARGVGGQRKRVSHLRELLLEKCLLRREGVSLYPLICNCFNQGSQTLSSPTRQKPTRCGDTALAIRPCTLARGHCSQPLFAVRSAARRTHSHRDASSPASFFTQAHHTPVLTKLSEPLAGYPNQACFAPSDCPAP